MAIYLISVGELSQLTITPRIMSVVPNQNERPEDWAGRFG